MAFRTCSFSKPCTPGSRAKKNWGVPRSSTWEGLLPSIGSTRSPLPQGPQGHNLCLQKETTAGLTRRAMIINFEILSLALLRVGIVLYNILHFSYRIPCNHLTPVTQKPIWVTVLWLRIPSGTSRRSGQDTDEGFGDHPGQDPAYYSRLFLVEKASAKCRSMIDLSRSTAF